jgi:hypothetical protein
MPLFALKCTLGQPWVCLLKVRAVDTPTHPSVSPARSGKRTRPARLRRASCYFANFDLCQSVSSKCANTSSHAVYGRRIRVLVGRCGDSHNQSGGIARVAGLSLSRQPQPLRPCRHRMPVALAPFVIRWGADASSDMLRHQVRCAGGAGRACSIRGGGGLLRS